MFKMIYIQQAFYYIYYGTNNLISLTIIWFLGISMTDVMWNVWMDMFTI